MVYKNVGKYTIHGSYGYVIYVPSMDLFHTDSCHLPGFSHSVMASPVGAVQDTYSVEAVGESRRFPAVCRLNIYTHKKRDDKSQVVPTKKTHG